MRREMPTPRNPLPHPVRPARPSRPALLDQLARCEAHPGDDGTGLLEWLALWQAPRGHLS